MPILRRKLLETTGNMIDKLVRLNFLALWFREVSIVAVEVVFSGDGVVLHTDRSSSQNFQGV